MGDAPAPLSARAVAAAGDDAAPVSNSPLPGRRHRSSSNEVYAHEQIASRQLARVRERISAWERPRPVEVVFRDLTYDVVAPPGMSTAADDEKDVQPAPSGGDGEIVGDVELGNLTVPADEDKKRILHGISGRVRPGEMMAILGPSGAGKSSLLNVLAQRTVSSSGTLAFFELDARESESEGSQSDGSGDSGTKTPVGRKRLSGRSVRRLSSYVQQDDLFFANLTVRDQLEFTGRLRLPSGLSRSQKSERVNTVLSALHLEKCADTKIGGAFARGVSGGERKRVNVACELLTDPSVMLLDEPTSGLDSSTALLLVHILRALADRGRTIICSIHQPSSQLFQLFDKVLVLGNGRTLFHGATDRMVPHFAAHGYNCRPLYNAADFAMDVASDPDASRRLADAYSTLSPNSKHEVGYDAGRESVDEAMALQKQQSTISVGPQPPQEQRWSATYMEQLRVLSRRALKQSLGNSVKKLTFFQVISIAVIIGLIWFDISEKADEIDKRVSALFFSSTFWLFFPMFNALSVFPSERAVVNRERSAGSYRLSAYFLSKTLLELPILFIFPIIYVVIVYPMTGMKSEAGAFFAFLGIILILSAASQSLGLLISCIVMDFEKAIVAASIVALTFMLVSGFFVELLVIHANDEDLSYCCDRIWKYFWPFLARKEAQIPIFIRWLQFLSMNRYSFSAIALNEFKGESYACILGISTDYGTCSAGVAAISGDQVLDTVGVTFSSAGANVGVLLAMTFGYRFLAYQALRHIHKPKSV